MTDRETRLRTRDGATWRRARGPDCAAAPRAALTAGTSEIHLGRASLGVYSPARNVCAHSLYGLVRPGTVFVIRPKRAHQSLLNACSMTRVLRDLRPRCVANNVSGGLFNFPKSYRRSRRCRSIYVYPLCGTALVSIPTITHLQRTRHVGPWAGGEIRR